MNYSNELVQVCIEFFKFAETATANGGIWISTGGGTANVIAGTISREIGVDYNQVHDTLNLVGGEDWYADLFFANGGFHVGSDYEFRFDARLVALAACRRIYR